MKIKKSRINWTVLIASLIIAYFTAFIGSLFTSSAVKSAWYSSIKPSITPPNYVFPIAWNILFFLIALSLYFAWTSSKKDQKKTIAWVFGINLILNIVWSILFFGMRNPRAAFIEIIPFWISIAVMMIATWKINKKASWLLLPYLLWVAFASILNFLSAF
jgi:benzodiazapine receptor